MAKSYRLRFPEQDFLLAPSLREWLSESGRAYIVSEMIDGREPVTAGLRTTTVRMFPALSILL